MCSREGYLFDVERTAPSFDCFYLNGTVLRAKFLCYPLYLFDCILILSSARSLLHAMHNLLEKIHAGWTGKWDCISTYDGWSPQLVLIPPIRLHCLRTRKIDTGSKRLINGDWQRSYYMDKLLFEQPKDTAGYWWARNIGERNGNRNPAEISSLAHTLLDINQWSIWQSNGDQPLVHLCLLLTT